MAVELDPNYEIVCRYFGFYRLDGLQDEPCAILEGSSVLDIYQTAMVSVHLGNFQRFRATRSLTYLICSPIDTRRQELREDIPMRCMDLIWGELIRSHEQKGPG